jgi:hypothetical protein
MKEASMAHAPRSRTRAFFAALTLVMALGTAFAGGAAAATNYGKISGVVVDPAGTPQMGANVTLIAEGLSAEYHTQFLTNQSGAFSNPRVPAGIYEVQVSLAGFLTKIQRHVRVSPNLTTILKVELATVFASLDRLRKGPQLPSGSDDWKWIIRASAAKRPVLQWADSTNDSAGGISDGGTGESTKRRAHAQLELASGSKHPGSISNRPDAPSTAFAYDQPVGNAGLLLFAGQVSYGNTIPATGIATVWIPSGDVAGAPVTEMVFRQTWLGANNLVFRGERISQRGSLEIGAHVNLRYSGEIISAQLGHSTQSIRPSADLQILISNNWQADVMVVSGGAASPLISSAGPSSAIAALDGFPVLMVNNGRPVLEGGWHEEIGVQHKIAPRTTVEAAAFHDHSAHTAVFGRGNVTSPDYLQDTFTNAFVYDGGSTDSWGARLAFKQRISESAEVAFVYAYGGALSPEELSLNGSLRDSLRLRYRHSVAGRVSAKVHRTGTQISASYKWMNGAAISPLDGVGEAFYDMDPYMTLSVRQPLPGSLWSCRWEALADVRNLFGQGYVSISTGDGRMVLMPATRSVRGGISFQF